MEPMRLSEIAAVLGAPLRGADASIAAVAIDSRRLKPGELFVAISGQRFDGHDFIAAAAAAGAAGALVQRADDWGLPHIVVDDTRLALGRLARALRLRLPVRLVGVTGSNGKTTVKEMTASILRRLGPALHTEGNLNNDLGVPLTLLRLDRSHVFGVIEMGASHAGEIDYLARLAVPDVGVVTNAGPAHLAGFGSVDGVARAKGELFAALPEHGVAVINADDPYAALWRGLAGARRVIDFGLASAAAVTAERIVGSRFLLRVDTGRVEVELPLPGRHNVMNALAAAAAATALGAPLEAVAEGLAATPRVKGRLNWLDGIGGARLLDDTYNANPNSLRAALEVLAAEPGERWLALGDMSELGPQARELHARVGEWARELGVSRLFAVGPLAAEAARVFGPDGEHFPDKGALVTAVREGLRPGVAVLIKGSRVMGMEQVTQALTAPTAIRGEET